MFLGLNSIDYWLVRVITVSCYACNAVSTKAVAKALRKDLQVFVFSTRRAVRFMSFRHQVCVFLSCQSRLIDRYLVSRLICWFEAYVHIAFRLVVLLCQCSVCRLTVCRAQHSVLGGFALQAASRRYWRQGTSFSLLGMQCSVDSS